MKIDLDVPIKMRDGIQLFVDIFRPEEMGKKVPALVSMSPYGKGIQSLAIAPLDYRNPVSDPAIEAGHPRYFVSRGYAHVIADVRGTGKSEGEYHGWMSKKEAEDGFDLIESVATADWCDGNIGMVGLSYFGDIQLKIAAEHPPHLRAIMPWNAAADFYRETTHHGGILQTFMYQLYYKLIGAERSVSAAVRSLKPEELQKLIGEAKNDPDLRLYTEMYNVLDCPGKHPCWFDILINPMDGPFYWERSPYRSYDKIKVPFYTRSAWWAYAHMHLVGAFSHYQGIDAPKKILVDRPVEEERPLEEEYSAEAVRWYDYWLKGIDNGIMNGPPMKLFVRGLEAWRFEKDWPLPSTLWTKYFFRRWENLSNEPETVEGKPDCFVQQPLDETLRIQSLQYFSKPLQKDLLLIGPASATLYASIDQKDTNWMISLSDVSEDGHVDELTMGFLKASHRKVDDSLSKPWQPYHSHLESEPVTPYKIEEYKISLAPVSNLFKVGHRIRGAIFSTDIATGSAHHPWHVCSSFITLHKVHHEERFQSHLLLPVIPQL